MSRNTAQVKLGRPLKAKRHQSTFPTRSCSTVISSNPAGSSAKGRRVAGGGAEKSFSRSLSTTWVPDFIDRPLVDATLRLRRVVNQEFNCYTRLETYLDSRVEDSLTSVVFRRSTPAVGVIRALARKGKGAARAAPSPMRIRALPAYCQATSTPSFRAEGSTCSMVTSLCAATPPSPSGSIMIAVPSAPAATSERY